MTIEIRAYINIDASNMSYEDVQKEVEVIKTGIYDAQGAGKASVKYIDAIVIETMQPIEPLPAQG